MSPPSSTMLPKSNRHALKPLDFALNPPVSALSELQSALRNPQIQLNLCQFKRILDALNNANTRTNIKLVLKLWHRCETWKNADILDSLVKSPGEMTQFENDNLIGPGYEQPSPSENDVETEMQAVKATMKKILFRSDLRTQVWELKDRDAECFLTRLQHILDQDHTCTDPDFREACINALRRLAIQTNILPASLLLQEVIVDDDSPAGSGGYGTVYKAKWNNIQVAVKYLHIESLNERLEARKNIRREMLLMRQIRHPNILPVLGIVEGNHREGLVSKWMPHGTIMQFLEKHPEVSKLEMLSQVAKGLKYIHEHRPFVIHGDLKGSNILIDSNSDGTYKAVIGDFGQSQMKYSIFRTKGTTVLSGGTLRWMAPELLSSDFTLKSDVYSFGMLIYEVMTGRPPYDEIKNLAPLAIAIMEGKRPTYGVAEISGDLRKLMVHCWETKPEDRPDIGRVDDAITRILGQSHITEEIVLAPTSLVDRIATLMNDSALQNVRVEICQGSVEREGAKYTSIAIKGRAPAPQKAKAWLEEKVETFRDTTTTVDMKVDRQFYGLIIGEKWSNIKRLMHEYSVKITIPPKDSTDDSITIEGRPESVDAAKEEILKKVNNEIRSRCILNVSPLAARIVLERREQLITPFLRSITVNIETGVITMRGHWKALDRAKESIRAIEKEVVSREITTISVSLDDHTYELIQGDPKFLADIKGRCLDSQEVVGATPTSSNSLELVGSQTNVALLQKELQEIMSLGHRYVLGERISEERHRSLLAKEEKLIEKIRRDARVMVYFPCSGGYSYHDMPGNMESLAEVLPEDIVKVVGRTEEACKRGCSFLKAHVEKQKEKGKINAPKAYKFPACLSNIVQRQLDPMFKTLGVGIVEDSKENLTSPHPILSFVSDNLVVLSGEGWKINKAPSWGKDSSEATLPMCHWKLNARSPQALVEAEKKLNDVISNTWRYVGVVDLPNIRQVNFMRSSSAISDAGSNMTCVIIEEHGRGRLIIGALQTSSTRKLESFIKKVILLMKDVD